MRVLRVTSVPPVGTTPPSPGCSPGPADTSWASRPRRRGPPRPTPADRRPSDALPGEPLVAEAELVVHLLVDDALREVGELPADQRDLHVDRGRHYVVGAVVAVGLDAGGALHLDGGALGVG